MQEQTVHNCSSPILSDDIPLHGQMVQALADVGAPVPDRWLGKAVVAQMCPRWESPQYQAGDYE